MNGFITDQMDNKFTSRKLLFAAGVVGLSTYMLNIGKMASQDFSSTTQVCVSTYMAGNVCEDLPRALGDLYDRVQKPVR